MRYISLAKKTLPSLVTFFIGVGAMYIANVLISRHASVEVTAQWATLNAFMMIGGTFAIFGFDQQLVREPQAAKLIAKTAIFNILGVAMVAGVLGYALNYIPSVFVGACVVIGFAVSALSFQWWRTNLLMTAAYLSNGAWRLTFLIGVALFFTSQKAELSSLLIGAYIVGFATIGFLFLCCKPNIKLTSIHSDISEVKDIYMIGSSYFMAALSLAVASYGESLVVRTLGSTEDVALYFKSVILFLFPGVMVNQYISAIVGPALRQNEERAISMLKRYKVWILIILILIWPCLVLAGHLLGHIIYNEIPTPLGLAFLLSLTSCMRLLYIIPSNFVGITATKTQLKYISIAFLGFALFFPILAWGLSEVGIAVIFAVAIANLINWTLRTLAGLTVVRQRFSLYPSKAT